jgi:hypothetical protein
MLCCNVDRLQASVSIIAYSWTFEVFVQLRPFTYFVDIGTLSILLDNRF